MFILEYMDSWERFDETSLPDKKAFYSFNMEDITDVDYRHAKRIVIKDIFFQADVEYPKKLHDLLSDLSFLSERMKINKCNKIVCNLYDKNNDVVHIKSLKQVLDHGLILKKCS